MVCVGVLVTTPSVYALTEGISGYAQDGCGPCHGSSASTNTAVAINGLPDLYEPNQNYSLTVEVTSTDVPGSDGGFDISVTEGTFVITNSTSTQISNGEVIQTGAGSHQRTWSFNWTAPTSGSVTFNVTGLASDGTGGAGGDAWATASYGLVIIPEFTIYTLLLAFAALTVVAFFFARTRFNARTTF